MHSYVDCVGVMNGVMYYYAVVSYDRGDSLGIPPSECTMKVVVDPISGEERVEFIIKSFKQPAVVEEFYMLKALFFLSFL